MGELKKYKAAVNVVEGALLRNPYADIDLLLVDAKDIRLYKELQEKPGILKEIYCHGMLGGDRDNLNSGLTDVVNAFRYMDRVDFKHPDYIKEGLDIVAEIHPDEAQKIVNETSFMSNVVRINELIGTLNQKCPELTRALISKGVAPNDQHGFDL